VFFLDLCLSKVFLVVDTIEKNRFSWLLHQFASHFSELEFEFNSIQSNLNLMAFGNKKF
jgi:hypothetical protein